MKDRSASSTAADLMPPRHLLYPSDRSQHLGKKRAYAVAMAQSTTGVEQIERESASPVDQNISLELCPKADTLFRRSTTNSSICLHFSQFSHRTSSPGSFRRLRWICLELSGVGPRVTEFYLVLPGFTYRYQSLPIATISSRFIPFHPASSLGVEKVIENYFRYCTPDETHVVKSTLLDRGAA
jgi:hypothetical protein